MTPHNSPPSVLAIPKDQVAVRKDREDLVAARKDLEWEMARKLFALASHLILRLRLDPACPSPAQIGSLLELASRFARLACDAPQPAAASPPDSGSLPPEIEAALARVYGPAPQPAPSSGAEPRTPNSSSTEVLLTKPDPSAEVLLTKADRRAEVLLTKADQPSTIT